MNDLIHFAMRRAAIKFGGSDGTFNAANFSVAMREITGLGKATDGIMVSAMLCGRSGVEVLSGGAHYRIL